MLQAVIQHVETIWTKQSRGGASAEKRNAVPSAVVMPDVADVQRFMLHHVTCRECDGFTRQDEMVATEAFDQLNLQCLSCRIDEDALHIRFHRDESNAAAPVPYPHKDAFALRAMEWGRIVYNGRYTAWNTGNWWYEKHVFNVGWFFDWAPDVFLATKPHEEFRELTSLW